MYTPEALLDALLRQLRAEMGEVLVDPWFTNAEPIAIRDDLFVVEAASELFRDTLTKRFTDNVSEIISGLLGRPARPLYVYGAEADSWRLQSDSSVYAGYTFEKFIVGNSNKFAHAAALAVANNPARLYNPLFIYGGSGLGKTHLLLAIGQQIHEKSPEKSIAYIKGDEFTNQLVKSIKDGTAEEFRQKYRNVDLFLVDDIQFIAGKQQTQNEFFHTFNNIYEAGHQIVIPSDRPPLEMSILDDRLRTRFEGGLMADIQPPDLETRMAITRNKAGQLGLLLSDDAVEYIATNITANIRQLEGVIKRLTAYKEILDDVITIDSVKRAIRDVIRIGTYIPTPESIIRETARYYSLKEEDLRGQSRSKNTAMARQVSMYLMRSLTNLSLKDIGAEYEDRNHATVLSSIRKVEDLLKTDPNMAGTVRDITSNINSI